MSDDYVDNTELQRRLEAAQQRVRKARAAEARLKRALVVTDRKLAATQKIVLGAALLRAVERHPQHTDSLRRLVLPCVTRPSDLAALRDTPFSPDADGPHAEPAAGSDAEA